MAAPEAHEDVLCERIEAALRELPGVPLWSRATRRTPTLFTTFEGRDPQDIRTFLGKRGVNAPPAPSTPARPPIGSASGTPAACASGWRRTTTTATSTGSSRA
nr:hypothetical protein [Pseudofrankia asymbiotica]